MRKALDETLLLFYVQGSILKNRRTCACYTCRLQELSFSVSPRRRGLVRSRYRLLVDASLGPQISMTEEETGHLPGLLSLSSLFMEHQ